MANRTGVAVIGFGGMGAWHVDTLAKVDVMRLAGIYDIAPSRQEAAAERGIHVFESMDMLLSDPAVDLVTIATPNDTHLPIAVRAMNAGKHVVCEKPVALSSRELSAMLDCSKQNDVLFTVHQNRRWDEDFCIAQKLLREGTLGRVFNVESRVHGSRGIPGDWRNTKEQGGGMVLDWGVHLIDQMHMMMEDRKLLSVWAQLSNVTNEEVDDGFRAVFQFDGDCTWLIEVGTSNFIALPRWYVQGENGTAVIRDWNLDGEVVMVSDWEKRDAVPVVTAAGLTKTMAPRTDETIKRYPLPEVMSNILDFYCNVHHSIQSEDTLIVQPSQVNTVMHIMEMVFESAKNNHVVTL